MFVDGKLELGLKDPSKCLKCQMFSCPDDREPGTCTYRARARLEEGRGVYVTSLGYDVPARLLTMTTDEIVAERR